MLTREEVLKIAKLARLELTDAEIEIYQKRLGKVLEHVRDLSALPIPPELKDTLVRHVPRDAVAFREDKALPFTSTKLLMDNAPAAEANSFLLPTILEHS